MDRAFGPEAEALLLDRHVPRIATVEIFAERFNDARADPLAQCSADVEILPRDAKRHGMPPFTGPCLTAMVDRTPRQRDKGVQSGCGECLLFAPALDRGRYPHRFPI